MLENDDLQLYMRSPAFVCQTAAHHNNTCLPYMYRQGWGVTHPSVTRRWSLLLGCVWLLAHICSRSYSPGVLLALYGQRCTTTFLSPATLGWIFFKVFRHMNTQIGRSKGQKTTWSLNSLFGVHPRWKDDKMHVAPFPSPFSV